MIKDIKPEGFKELIDYLSKCEDQSAKASEIQESLRKEHGFTSGKITGIIKRAEDQRVIVKLNRGYYKLNLNAPSYTADDNKVSSVIDKAITEAINTIQNMAGQNITNLSPDDLKKIQTSISQLNEIIKITK